MKKLTLAIALLLIWTFANTADSMAKKDERVQMLQWEEVNKLIPKFSTFRVEDLETGKRFTVQRRAGSSHADVQPISKKHTKTMKKIYSGKWSWKRRAIIVEHKGKRIAASMHGMPHGAGAITNNFPGHFCIHFFGSTTHRTDHMDLSHKLMVFKAAGQLEGYLAAASPLELINAYIAGFKEEDEKILNCIILEKRNYTPVFKKVENVNISQISVPAVNELQTDLFVSVPVEIEWYLREEGRVKFEGNINLIRYSPDGPWKVDSEKFLEENRFIE
ncbi:hypothetical protein CVD25_06900 [Bacillus canaveralius]|uniref:DUF3888 domain-containing protein n=1 Tax=Bacillus canaveralius TaxID=1403243 RepID=A0A2N5GIZ0_9BACI|nr:hypothetical protein [Bacillus canaveralius]PLR81025.1 hypothetical protein CU635_16050 [Bacillus canaveralius]PLR99040.1 hypothetical protein CVD25_06900 [Bacillus canaveralius]